MEPVSAGVDFALLIKLSRAAGNTSGHDGQAATPSKAKTIRSIRTP